MSKRSGLTLIEVLVVVGIIGVLMAMLVPVVGRIRENAYASRCESNLKNLAHAVISFANNNDGWMPRASPREVYYPWDGKYYERAAWVNWIQVSPRKLRGEWQPSWGHRHSRAPWASDVSQRHRMEFPTWFGDDARTSIMEGQLWPFLRRDIRTYLCPKFARREVCGRDDAVRSYVMNDFFTNSRRLQGLEAQHGRAPSRLLLFADMHAEQRAPWGNNLDRYARRTGDAASVNGALRPLDADDPKTRHPRESFGFLHRGRAMVIFVDGHTEQLDPGYIEIDGQNVNVVVRACEATL